MAQFGQELNKDSGETKTTAVYEAGQWVTPVKDETCGKFVRDQFLHFSHVQPKRVPFNITIEAGDAYILHALATPPVGKVWQVYNIDGSATAKTGVQDLAINGENIGVYIFGTDSADVFGSMQFANFYGPDGLWITHDDALTIRKSSSDTVQRTITLVMSLNEWTIRT